MNEPKTKISSRWAEQPEDLQPAPAQSSGAEQISTTAAHPAEVSKPASEATPAADPVTASAPDASTPKSVEELRADLDAANAKLAQLSAHNAELTVKNTELTARNQDADAVEVLIREKMAKGLTREQATSVIRNQRKFDQSDFGKMQAAIHKQRQSGN